MPARPMLILGRFSASARKGLLAAATDSGLALELVGDADAAMSAAADRRFQAIVVDTSIARAREVFNTSRTRRELAWVPVVALSRAATDLAFARAYQWGADDLIPRRGVPELVSRLAALPTPDQTAGTPACGPAVVADTNHARCDLVGRVLSNAGYEVRYAVDDRSAQYYLESGQTQLVVMDFDFPRSTAMLESHIASGRDTPWVFLAKPRHARRAARFATAYQHVAAIEAFSPPENILFIANELRAGDYHAQRKSRRILFGTIARFRLRGASYDEYGYTYTVSGGGIFVRSLLRPKDRHLWIDVQPPKSDRLVRLGGIVRWHRPFGPSRSATVPAGFGVEFMEGLGDDMDVWGDAYVQLLEMKLEAQLAQSQPPAAEPRNPRDLIADLIREEVSGPEPA